MTVAVSSRLADDEDARTLRTGRSSRVCTGPGMLMSTLLQGGGEGPYLLVAGPFKSENELNTFT